MPLVSGRIPGDSRSALGIEKTTNIDKADAFVKRVVKATSPAEIQQGALGGFARVEGAGLQRFWHPSGTQDLLVASLGAESVGSCF